MENVKQLEALEIARKEQEEQIRLNSLFTPKTSVQRNEPIARFVNATTYGLQAVSIILAGGLIVKMYNRMPSLSLLVVPACILFLAALELGKRICIDGFNKSRLSDSKVSYASASGMVFLTVLSMYVSYSFTASAINAFSTHAPLQDIALLKAEGKESLAASLQSLGKDKDALLKSKEDIKRAGIKYDKKIKGKRLSSSAVVSLRGIEKELTEVNRRIEQVTSRNNSLVDGAVAKAEANNAGILESHAGFNGSLSGVLSICAGIIDLLLVFLASFVWSHNFAKSKELDAKMNISFSKEDAKEIKEPVKSESKERVKTQETETQRSTVAGFAGPRAGDLVDGKVCIAVKAGPYRGSLKKYDKRALQNLINNSSAKRAQELKPLLTKFN